MCSGKSRGSILIECIAGMFIIATAGLVMVSVFSSNHKITKNVGEVETAKEIERLIVKEIKYNISVCEALKVFKEEKRYPVEADYFNEAIKNNDNFLEGVTINNDKDFFRVKLVENKEESLRFTIESNLTGEGEFYKYPFN